ncbi:MAG: polyisoprenoid-binding protein YceI, partial [Myxococcota bacterium]
MKSLSLKVVIPLLAATAGIAGVAGFMIAKQNLTPKEFKDKLAQEDKKQDDLDALLDDGATECPPCPECKASVVAAVPDKGNRSDHKKPAALKLAPAAPDGFKGGTAKFGVQSFGMSRVSFTSDAPLETIVGTTSKVNGELEVDLSDVTKTKAAAINVEVATLKTGIDMRDEHLQGEGWFDTAKHPNAVFSLESVEVTDGGTKLWPGHKVKATLKGKLTIKGVSKPVEAASTIGFYAHTP